MISAIREINSKDIRMSNNSEIGIMNTFLQTKGLKMIEIMILQRIIHNEEEGEEVVEVGDRGGGEETKLCQKLSKIEILKPSQDKNLLMKKNKRG